MAESVLSTVSGSSSIPGAPPSTAVLAVVRSFTGERHDRAWAHYQHLWVSERAAHLATLASLAGREDAATRANAVLQAYRNYPAYPNRDNVLGPSRLFFSTYLESIWLTNYLAAATLLREGGLLEAETAESGGRGGRGRQSDRRVR